MYSGELRYVSRRSRMLFARLEHLGYFPIRYRRQLMSASTCRLSTRRKIALREGNRIYARYVICSGARGMTLNPLLYLTLSFWWNGSIMPTCARSPFTSTFHLSTRNVTALSIKPHIEHECAHCCHPASWPGQPHRCPPNACQSVRTPTPRAAPSSRLESQCA